MERYICIHGHFYQPPRENAWLEYVEMQDSAYPYHDWNERVTAECYAPNTASRILDSEDYITQIVNNYTKTSFDFGPTLLAWMEEKAPDVYQAILEADRETQQTFSGHGSALAEVHTVRFLSELGNPIPRSFQSAAEFILNSDLRKAISVDSLDLDRISSILDEIRTWKVQLDTEGLSYLLQQTLEGTMTKLATAPEDVGFLSELLAAAEMFPMLPFPVDLWKVQNIYHKMLRSAYLEFQERAQQGDEVAQGWLNQFLSLGQQLSMRVG